MGRRKLKIEWIQNEAARTLSMRKRREGLVKKTKELSTLCGVDAMVVVYNGPNDPEPAAVWPPEAGELMERYRSIPVLERTGKDSDMESFLIDQINKIQLKEKSLKEREKLEFDYLMDELHFGKGIEGFGLHELDSLQWLLVERITKLRRRGALLMNQGKTPADELELEEGSNSEISSQNTNLDEEVDGFADGIVYPGGLGNGETSGEPKTGDELQEFDFFVDDPQPSAGNQFFPKD